MISAVLPIRTVSVANVREHWAKRAKRAAEHRNIAKLSLRRETHKVHDGQTLKPIVVSMTRVAPRDLDGDNLQGSLKACRDGIADALLTDDRNPLISWEYRQMKGRPKEYAVLVEIIDRSAWEKLP